jgi:hypothetical protein
MFDDRSMPAARGPRVWWRAQPRRRRRGALVVCVLALVVIGGVLARYLSADNVERSDELALVQAQTRGDVAGMLARLSGCRSSPSCLAAVKADAGNSRLRRTGSVKILQLESPTASSLFGATAKTRLAWTVIGTLPVVQCVEVRRTGNFLTGLHVQLVGLSAPISNEGVCTPHPAQEKLEREEDEEMEGR